MSLPYLSPARQLLLGAALFLSAAAAGVVAWLHGLAVGGAPFLCGSAQAHCWACYAAPALAFLAVGVLTAPARELRRAPAR